MFNYRLIVIYFRCNVIRIHPIFLLNLYKFWFLNVLFCVTHSLFGKGNADHLECTKTTTRSNLLLPRVIGTFSFLLEICYSRNKGLCFAWVGNTFLIGTFLLLISCWDEERDFGLCSRQGSFRKEARMEFFLAFNTEKEKRRKDFSFFFFFNQV